MTVWPTVVLIASIFQLVVLFIHSDTAGQVVRHHLCVFELSQASFSNSINSDKPNWTYLSGRKIRKRARVTDGWTHTEEDFTMPTWCNSHLLLLAATRQSKYQHHITKPEATIVSLLSRFIILFEFQISFDLFPFSAAFPHIQSHRAGISRQTFDVARFSFNSTLPTLQQSVWVCGCVRACVWARV